MSYPKAYFNSSPDPERPGTCFVLMPFSSVLEPVYEAVRGALESSVVGFSCRRADELFGGDQIMSGVLREISRAQLIIGDLTGRNPNVFYELGLAHMTKDADRVLLLTQRMDDVPFDLRAYRCILYKPDEQGLRELGKQVIAAVKAVAGLAYRFTVARGQGHKTEPLFPSADRYLYSFEVSEAMLGIGFVKCSVRIWRHAIGSPAKCVEDSACGFNVGEARKLADLSWELRLDSATESEASFSIVREDDSANPRRPT